MIDEAGPQEIDSQNFDVNIDKIYNNFIVEIDKIRSHVSVQDNPSFNDITSYRASTAPMNVNIDRVAQESRCHAFYRLLGLPVTDGTSLYTPGFDKLNNNKTTIEAKLTIARNLFKKDKIKDLFDARENIPRTFLSIFALQDVESMVLTMSLAEVRSFKSSLQKVNGVFDTDQNHISYTIDTVTRLSKTVQNNNRFIDSKKITSTRKHILIPFIVDPRIELNINPKRNMLAVPFLKDKSETLISENTFLKRPYIEKVCRERLDSSSVTTNLGTQTQAIIENIKDNQYIKNDSLIKKAFNPNNITSETIQFANYLNSIRSVLLSLKSAIDKVTPVMAADLLSMNDADWNWIPIASKSGPEFGCTARDLFNGQPNDPFNTEKDKSLINTMYERELINISNKINNLDTPDAGGLAFDNNEITPDHNSSDSFGDVSEAQIVNLTNQRKNQTDAADSAVKTIEIITGEFSGLGLIDILVISAAFWVIDKKYLLGLLDDTAIDRMLLYPNLQADEVKARKAAGSSGIEGSLLEFQNKVKEIFEICDQLWAEIEKGNIK